MSTESFVQVAPDSTGKAIDAIAVTVPSTGATQYRQTTTLGDDNFAGNTQEVGSEGDALVRSYTIEDLLTQMLVELRIHSAILHATLGCRDDLDALRAEAQNTAIQTSQ